jgi:TetR/AcrR family fatty acid metabolism transcriptional regulator
VFRRKLNEKMVTKCFFGVLDEMATNWILSKRRYDLAALSDAVVDLFVGGLRTPAKRPGPRAVRRRVRS